MCRLWGRRGSERCDFRSGAEGVGSLRLPVGGGGCGVPATSGPTVRLLGTPHPPPNSRCLLLAGSAGATWQVGWRRADLVDDVEVAVAAGGVGMDREDADGRHREAWCGGFEVGLLGGVAVALPGDEDA